MARKKAFDIIDAHVLYKEKKHGHKGMDGVHALANALYVSAKGTNHFYEALDLITDILPDEESYKEEFEMLKNKY